MGAWGDGVFENDSAGDLVALVAHTPADEVAALIDAALDDASAPIHRLRALLPPRT